MNQAFVIDLGQEGEIKLGRRNSPELVKVRVASYGGGEEDFVSDSMYGDRERHTARLRARPDRTIELSHRPGSELGHTGWSVSALLDREWTTAGECRVCGHQR